MRVRIADQDKAYNVFARTAAKGRLPLGGNERERTGAAGMYFVVTQTASAPDPPARGDAR